MKKTTRNYLLDIAMGLLGILLAISSFLLWVVFPRGYHATRALWVDIHKWGGLALSILAGVHLVLHWKWLVQMTRLQMERIRKR